MAAAMARVASIYGLRTAAGAAARARSNDEERAALIATPSPRPDPKTIPPRSLPHRAKHSRARTRTPSGGPGGLDKQSQRARPRGPRTSRRCPRDEAMGPVTLTRSRQRRPRRLQLFERCHRLAWGHRRHSTHAGGGGLPEPLPRRCYRPRSSATGRQHKDCQVTERRSDASRSARVTSRQRHTRRSRLHHAFKANASAVSRASGDFRIRRQDLVFCFDTAGTKPSPAPGLADWMGLPDGWA